MLGSGTHVVVGGTCLDAQLNPLAWPTWAWRCLLAFAVAMAAFAVAGSASNVARSTGLLRDMGSLGMTLEQTAGTPMGWSEVVTIAPDGPKLAGGLLPAGIRLTFGYTPSKLPLNME